MNRRRVPRRSSTAPSQFGNPTNLQRARRFPVPRNDLPSNRDDLFELVVQTTTSALTQNLRIEELIPILRQLRHRRTEDISNVLADVTQLLERDLLALVGLSEAITRIPTTPPVAPPTPEASSRRRAPPVMLEDTDNERTPRPRRARATLLRTGSCFECFSPGHVRINCRWYQCPMCHSSRLGHLSRLCPLRVTEEPPEPSTPLMVRLPADPPVAVATIEDDSLTGSSTLPRPRPIEENPDPNILTDDRLPTVEQTPPDLIVTTSIEVPTSPSNPVEEVLIEERPLLEYWDVFPIEVISPTPIRHTPVGPSPLREAFSYVSDDEEPDPVSPTPLYLDSPPESPPSSSLPSRSSNDSSDTSSSPSPVNDDTEDSA
ncbi:hypothetical protein BU15DRAFT_80595 [Melanogaster broomeanus]|nr:hypothetical protein BU15DRAFT_80595 [Melanogaster broomeanus]